MKKNIMIYIFVLMMTQNSYSRTDTSISSKQLSSIVESLTNPTTLNPINKGENTFGLGPAYGEAGVFVKTW